MTSPTTARIGTLEARVQELLEANNRYVEINRKLKDQLMKDAEKFKFYANEHTNKAKKFADAGDKEQARASLDKSDVNLNMAYDILMCLEENSPT